MNLRARGLLAGAALAFFLELATGTGCSSGGGAPTPPPRPGSPDPSFGAGGGALVPVFGGGATPGVTDLTAVGRLPDGRIVLGGRMVPASGPAGAVSVLALLTPAGGGDPGFGNAGLLFVGGWDGVAARFDGGGVTCLDVGSDGKVTAAGGALISSGGSFRPGGRFLARFDALGQPDPGFGISGFVDDSGMGPVAVADLSGGGVLVAWTALVGSSLAPAVGRYSASGTRDSSYGAPPGAVLFPSTADGLAATISPGERVAFAASWVDSAGREVNALARYRSGAPDPGWAPGGVALDTSLGLEVRALVAPTDLDPVLVAGLDLPEGRASVAAYLGSGPATAYGNGGRTSSSSTGAYASIVFLPEDDAGNFQASVNGPGFQIDRLSWIGFPAGGWASNGTARFTFPGATAASLGGQALLVQPDDKLVLAGTVVIAGTPWWAAVRFLP